MQNRTRVKLNVRVRSVLTYGCHALYLSQRSLRKLEVMQGKLVKSFLGLSKYSHTSPLLDALNIQPVYSTIVASSMKMLHSCLSHSSNAKHFYCSMLCLPLRVTKKTLVNRVVCYAKDRNIDFTRFSLRITYQFCFLKIKPILLPLCFWTTGQLQGQFHNCC